MGASRKKFKPRNIIPGWSFLEYCFLRLFVAIINLFPVSISAWLGRRVGDVLFFLIPERKKVALENLSIVYGDSISKEAKGKIARQAFHSLVTALMEFFRTPAMLSHAAEAGAFEFEGTEHLDSAFKKGKGIIFVISHLGSWEYLAFLPYLKGYPCSVVVRETRNPYIYSWIQNLRAVTKLNPIPKKSSVREILREIKKNHLVAILIDQWAGRDGIAVDFFGRPTSTTSIPARLASRTGAALIPGYCLRTAVGKYRIVIRPEVPLNLNVPDWEIKTTERLNRLLEKEILQYPGQWVWTHRRWKNLK